MKLFQLAILSVAMVSCSPGLPAGSETTTYDNKVSAADTTLEGQDDDKNGVRDDVDMHIEKSYPAGENRQMATRYAQIVQEKLTTTTVEDAISTATTAEERLTCFIERYPNDWQAKSSLISALTLNNEARSAAYLAYREKLGGQIIDIPETPCDPSL